ncbi:DUF488 domain-containing protein [Variovorax sp. HJSM1_2]|uniref:DUF488 domain-containing protein n=1 Tax=Variovorax sp. HJSM1_2 TaxID=3366263 RepID=UPI003BD39BBB
MAIAIVQLGSPRPPNEGLRVGTVRRPPRGVPKAEFASRNYYDVWLPLLSPSVDLMKEAQAAQALQGVAADKAWAVFTRKFRAELEGGEAARVLDLLAAMSLHANLAVGCYCDDEARCHRSVLRALLVERGAKV